MIGLFALSLLALPPALARSAALVAPRLVEAGADTVPDDSLGLSRSLRFAGDVVRHLHERGYAHPTGTFAFDTDSARSTLFPQVWGSNVPDSAFAGLAPLVRGVLPGWPGSGPVMVSFRLDREAAFAGARPCPCPSPPELTNLRHVRERMDAILGSHPDARWRSAGWRRRARITVLVDTDGTVALVNVSRMTGDPSLDRYFVALAYEMRFRPAIVDGVPVPVFATMPLGFDYN